jgi:7,8-dihydro-6-hydroxymethylpterin-pyrophosphokinase
MLAAAMWIQRDIERNVRRRIAREDGPRLLDGDLRDQFR